MLTDPKVRRRRLLRHCKQEINLGNEKESPAIVYNKMCMGKKYYVEHVQICCSSLAPSLCCRAEFMKQDTNKQSILYLHLAEIDVAGIKCIKSGVTRWLCEKSHTTSTLTMMRGWIELLRKRSDRVTRVSIKISFTENCVLNKLIIFRLECNKNKAVIGIFKFS